jgi:Berberine and berberine like
VHEEKQHRRIVRTARRVRESEFLRPTGCDRALSVSGGYANYMQADEPLDRVRAAFGPESFARLQALKSRYDPDNVLHRNQNIPPAG